MDWTSSARVRLLAGVPLWSYVFYSSVQKNLLFGVEISRPHSRRISILIHNTGKNMSGVYSPFRLIR